MPLNICRLLALCFCSFAWLPLLGQDTACVAILEELSISNRKKLKDARVTLLSGGRTLMFADVSGLLTVYDAFPNLGVNPDSLFLFIEAEGDSITVPLRDYACRESYIRIHVHVGEISDLDYGVTHDKKDGRCWCTLKGDHLPARRFQLSISVFSICVGCRSGMLGSNVIENRPSPFQCWRKYPLIKLDELPPIEAPPKRRLRRRSAKNP